MVVGPGRTVGEHMINDARLALVSFTGSSEIGIHVSEVVHRRFGRTILELGGNNATISALERGIIRMGFVTVMLLCCSHAGR
jgi:acyl-CoA reductase-like NAD-dependent aldehyde dehydrogenase